MTGAVPERAHCALRDNSVHTKWSNEMKRTKRKSRKWGVLTAVFAVLMVVCIVGTLVANSYAAVVNIFLQTSSYKTVDTGEVVDTEYFKSKFSSEEEVKANDRAVAEELMGEGAVLLKNEDNALPLSAGSRISLFSQSVVDYVTCGTGSAFIKTDEKPTMKEALENVGLTVNPVLWQFYDSGEGSDYERNPNGSQWLTKRWKYKMNEVPVSAYTDMVKQSFGAFGDAAIVLISRVSGENYDMPADGFEDGTDSLELTQEEKDMFQFINDSGFETVIVLINSTNALECGFLEEYGVDACLWIGYTGTWGMNAVAQILTGEINPSGHLPDTFAYDNSAAPSMADFYTDGETHKYVNHNSDTAYYTIYQEGIYIGYKYFETRYEDVVMGTGNAGNYDYNGVVAYPFGYGLSYTDFQWSDYTCVYNEGTDQYEISVTVTNVGNVAGKDVVEIYYQSEYTDFDRENDIEKSAVELCGFDKTELLAPGQSETVTIAVNRSELTAYDANVNKTYILEIGDYYIAAGTDAHDALNNILAAKGYSAADGMTAEGNAGMTFKFHVDATDAETYSVSAATGNEITNQFEEADINYYLEDTVTYLSRSDWQGTWPRNNVYLMATDEMLKLIEQEGTYLADTDNDEVDLALTGQSGKLTLAMFMDEPYDSEAWEALLDQVTFDEMAELIGIGYHQTQGLTSINKPATTDENGPQGFTQTLSGVSTCYCAYTDQNIMAATWNVELLERVGESLGEDMLWLGSSGIYAPGANIHRSAYSGRNFEYYSEDAFLSGMMAAAEVRGIQSKGAYAYVKHFALNDSETNRAGLCIWANEQTIRETYLKAFELAVTEGGAHNVMASFSRVGAVWSGAHKGLMTNVLRGEWGMDGFAISDFSAQGGLYDVCYGLLAGTDIWDSSSTKWADVLKEGNYKNDPVLLNAMRQATKRILYTVANSNAMNGYSSSTQIVKVTPWWQTALYALDGVLVAMTVVSVVMLVTTKRKEKKLHTTNETT